jgi:hypothetical protein
MKDQERKIQQSSDMDAPFYQLVALHMSFPNPSSSSYDLYILPIPPPKNNDSHNLTLTNPDRYAEGALKTKNVDSTRLAISSLLEKYRSAGDASNVVHVVQEVPAGAPVFTPNTRLAAEFDELTPNKGEKVIAKHHPGSFAETDLDEYLRSLGDKGE